MMRNLKEGALTTFRRNALVIFAQLFDHSPADADLWAPATVSAADKATLQRVAAAMHGSSSTTGTSSTSTSTTSTVLTEAAAATGQQRPRLLLTSFGGKSGDATNNQAAFKAAFAHCDTLPTGCILELPPSSSSSSVGGPTVYRTSAINLTRCEREAELSFCWTRTFANGHLFTENTTICQDRLGTSTSESGN
jgi:hypothetical protein